MTIRILDGGMGQELIARAGQATPLWSLQALLDAPDMVGDVHADYFAAGAEFATTNTYSVLPDRLERNNVNSTLEEMQQIACLQAVRARDAHGSGTVLGAMGPLGFSYQPDQAPPAEQAAEIYDRICKLQSKYVDAFMAETMASVDQTLGALMGMSGNGKPFYVSISVDDNDGTVLRSGEKLTDLLPVLAQYELAGVNINCSSPEAVTTAIPFLIPAGIPVGAYANGFTKIHEDFKQVGVTVDLLEARTDLGPEVYADFAQKWADTGATLIGGCCEVGPAHIKELKRRFG